MLGKQLCLLLVFILLWQQAASAADDSVAPPTAKDLAAITQRGQSLFDYDQAASDASDAVAAQKPNPAVVGRYLVHRTDQGWSVSFGRLSAKQDAFLLAYTATRATKSGAFTVQQFDPPKTETDTDVSGALAIQTAIADFGAMHRPYNVAVLPADNNQWYVYLYPAQTRANVWPVGGDTRYLISPDGKTIIDKHPMHKTVLEDRIGDDATVAITHTAILGDAPEDTDVFHVLAVRPPTLEFIGTRHFIYRLNTDGTITDLGRLDDQKK